MKIVIDIPEDVVVNDSYANYFECLSGKLYETLHNGTPLPEGHGRLIDESDLMPDSDYEDGLFYAVSIRQINSAPTIIEADTESEDNG